MENISNDFKKKFVKSLTNSFNIIKKTSNDAYDHPRLVFAQLGIMRLVRLKNNIIYGKYK